MDQDTLDKLATGEYSISPRSGRLRKKVRLKKKSPFFSKNRMKKYGRMSLWVLLVVSVIISLVIVIPELNITSSNKQENIEKAKKNFAPPR
ncbi:MAG: hypothetical protein IPG90_12095 [Bacteroidetes bacterium]|nr:hypothetical protein [Bacteroidota bacterium]MBP6401076.1 hypothetical protein [Bacteroidia bacterium]MBK6838886.1 hypothetical protein [Bacteroidota bacterium]MBK9526065.1 hypothetical protein [Bacteroidota bacterium]MBK9542812.1 hypothetical protein [Bacteroidota bacterium]